MRPRMAASSAGIACSTRRLGRQRRIKVMALFFAPDVAASDSIIPRGSVQPPEKPCVSCLPHCPERNKFLASRETTFPRWEQNNGASEGQGRRVAAVSAHVQDSPEQRQMARCGLIVTHR